jgi:hypothetical protein
MCCVCVFSLHRESFDMILRDKPLLFQGGSVTQAFGSSRRVPAMTPASRAFRFVTPPLMRKECLSSFAGSRRYRRSPSRGRDGLAGWRLTKPYGQRLGAEGVAPVFKRRLLRQRSHVPTPHWSVKKWPCNVIVWITSLIAYYIGGVGS